jgi:hypothetical protein
LCSFGGEKTSKKVVFFIPLAAIVMFLTIMPAYAYQPTDISGNWRAISPGTISATIAGGNVFLAFEGATAQYYQGDMIGTLTQNILVVFHYGDSAIAQSLDLTKPSTWPQTDWNWHIDRTFTGTVLGSDPGTLTMKLEAKGYGRIGAPVSIEGTWVIISGSDGLANLHGQGTWQNTATQQNQYQGQVKFSP